MQAASLLYYRVTQSCCCRRQLGYCVIIFSGTQQCVRVCANRFCSHLHVAIFGTRAVRCYCTRYCLRGRVSSALCCCSRPCYFALQRHGLWLQRSQRRRHGRGVRRARGPWRRHGRAIRVRADGEGAAHASCGWAHTHCVVWYTLSCRLQHIWRVAPQSHGFQHRIRIHLC